MRPRKVVLFPSPGAGHLVSMIEFAKRILHHAHELSITILLIRPPLSSVLGSSSISHHVDAVAASGLDINFVELRQQQGSKPEAETLIENLDFIDSHKLSVSETLADLASTITISAFIVDMFCITMTSVSMALGIPSFVFFTSGAIMLSATLHLPTMDQKYECDFKDLKEVHIPGRPPLPSSALPDVIREKKDPVYQWFKRTAHLYCPLDGILVNTFYELEQGGLKALADGLCFPEGRTPPTFPVGPLVDLGAVSESKRHGCIKWLDQQPHSSVVFLCFGSMGAFSSEQIRELARGLELSGHRFLWSVRVRSGQAYKGIAEPGDADLDEDLPAGFVERTKQRGLVWPTWAPQVEILAHPAIGGFVSHCGWNSTLESMWFGVPMIAWPLYAEQLLNATVLVVDLGVALGLRKGVGEGVDGLVSGEELERAVKSLMEGEEGKRAREKMTEMKEYGRRAVEEGGSSYMNLATLVHVWSASG